MSKRGADGQLPTSATGTKKAKIQTDKNEESFPSGSSVTIGSPSIPEKDMHISEAVSKENHHHSEDVVVESGVENPKNSPSPSKTSKGDHRSAPANATKRICVQTILPKRSKDFIDENQIAQYCDALKKRIASFSAYTNKAANTYSLGNILPTATWGRYHPLSDHSKVLCNPATNEPVIIWIVGHIVTLWFKKDGVPDKQASISIAPLSDSLRMQTLRLLAGLSVPTEASVDCYGSALRAVKWQSSKGKNEPVLFSSVYDAREIYKAKNEMEIISAVDLKKNDLVMLEAKITHYRLKDNKTEKWGHRAQLEMHAISLLNRAPEVDPEDEDVEQREIKDLIM